MLVIILGRLEGRLEEEEEEEEQEGSKGQDDVCVFAFAFAFAFIGCSSRLHHGVEEPFFHFLLSNKCICLLIAIPSEL